jgi:hypothetical protein
VSTQMRSKIALQRPAAERLVEKCVVELDAGGPIRLVPVIGMTELIGLAAAIEKRESWLRQHRTPPTVIGMDTAAHDGDRRAAVT